MPKRTGIDLLEPLPPKLETPRAPREAIAAGRARLIRALRRASDAAYDLQRLATLLDKERVTHAVGLSTFALQCSAEALESVYMIANLELLPERVTVKRPRPRHVRAIREQARAA